MLESDFQTEFSHSCYSQFSKGLYEKLRDPMADSRGVVKAKKLPFDCFLLYEEKFYAFELKLIKKCEGFNFNKIQKHQVDALLKVENNYQNGYLVVNYRFFPDKNNIKKHNLYNKKYIFTFAMDISSFLMLKYNLLKSGYKSIPIEIILEAYKNPNDWKMFNFISYRTIKNKIVWDIERFIQKNTESEI